MISTYWRVWYRAADELWHQVTYELADRLGHISGPFFPSLEAAESAARRLTESGNVREINVREERTVLEFKGGAWTAS